MWLHGVNMHCTRQVGRDNLVGKENGALLCMMRNLEIERVTLAAMGLGIARSGQSTVNIGGRRLL